MERIINHFTDDDLYKFTMCCAVIDNFPRAQVKYRFTDRDHTVYPPGFADELQKQIILLEDVVITDEEIAFMKRRCSYIPGWFYTYLKGYRFCREWVTVRQDEEGMQTMRTLGNNMAWLLKCIELGKKEGIPFPEGEKKIATNFIRK